MKVIDLLNKIANGEKVPKILHNGKYGIYEKEKRAVAFYNDEKCTIYFGSWFNWELCEDGLNDEIEIIEEDNKIEKIGNDYYHKTQPEQNQIFQRKINEIIDYIMENK